MIKQTRKRWSSASVLFFFALVVATRADGVYSGAGALLVKRSFSRLPSDDIGTGLDASTKYVYHKYFVVQTASAISSRDRS
jgi:hypothetical protein